MMTARPTDNVVATSKLKGPAAKPKVGAKRPAQPKKAEVKPKPTLIEVAMSHATEKAERSRSLAKRNLQLTVAALLSAVSCLLIALTTSSIHGYVNSNRDGTFIELPSVAKHDGILESDVYSFASDAMRKCLTFTYLSKSYVINECLGDYLTPNAQRTFAVLVNEKFASLSKDHLFDIETKPQHAATRVDTKETFVDGRAAWKIVAPFELTLHFHDDNDRTKIWQFVMWVVREYPTINPRGFAISSVAMKEIEG